MTNKDSDTTFATYDEYMQFLTDAPPKKRSSGKSKNYNLGMQITRDVTSKAFDKNVGRHPTHG